MPVVPAAHTERIRQNVGKAWWAPAGTLTDAYAPSGTGSQLTLGTTATTVPGSTTPLPLGITAEGWEFKNSQEWADIEAAEYNFPVATVPTSAACSLAGTLLTVNLTTLRVSMNAPANLAVGTPSATTVASLVAPLPGEQVHGQVMYLSNAADHLLVLFDTIQVAEVTEQFKKGTDVTQLAVEFRGLQPSASVSARPWKRYVIGASWVETVNAD